MELIEIQDPAQAREYLLQSLWLQRVLRPVGARTKTIWEWTLEIASNGHALPPVGFIADLGAIVFGLDGTKLTREPVEVPGWPANLARSYEDHLLGKCYADWTFERATDAIRRYTGRDRAKGLAYVIRQFRERGKLGGVELSPAVIRGLMALSGEECLNQGYTSLADRGPLPLLIRQYEALVSAARRMAEILGPEDVLALEQRTALADMGPYVAHRQIVQTTDRLLKQLPMRPVKPLVGRREVPTRVLDEDQYPVGGYSSISNRGSIESLLHSQLAFMEPEERPDLFDVKFVRDELFFYSRDENQFLRRRRVFAFIFDPSLISARFKDATLPCQRIVMVQSLVLALIRRLTDWLSSDAIRFELIFPRQTDTTPLMEEAKLFELLLSDLRETGQVAVFHPQMPEPPRDLLESPRAALQKFDQLARMAQVQVLWLGHDVQPVETESAVLTTLSVPGPRPRLRSLFHLDLPLPAEDDADAWLEAAITTLQLWV
jgi:hypothetical protein